MKLFIQHIKQVCKGHETVKVYKTNKPYLIKKCG